MKIIVALLMMGVAGWSWAIMPSPALLPEVTVEKYGQFRTVYVMPLPGLAGDYYPWVAMEPATSLSALSQAVRNYGLGQPHAALYPIKLNGQSQWTWGQYRQPDSLVVASTRLVGFDPPFPNMADQIEPAGPQRQMYDDYLQTLRQSASLDDVYGQVEVELVYVTFQSTADCPCDTALLVDGLPQPITRQSDMILAPLYVGQTPHGHVPNQTMSAWYATGLNQVVDIVPGQSRLTGRSYDVPGIINQVINGYVVPMVLPFTRCQFDSAYPLIYQSNSAWNEFIAPVLAAQGVDVSIGNPRRALGVVYLQDWGSESVMNTARWPHAFLGSGITFLSAIFQGDLSMPAVFFHEFAHAIFSWWDHYWPWGDDNDFDPLGTAVYNQGGWVTPYPVASSAHQHHAWPARLVSSLADSGLVSLRPFESVYWENPCAPPDGPVAPDSIERIYLTAIPNIGGNSGIGFSGPIRLLVTHTWKGCDFG